MQRTTRTAAILAAFSLSYLLDTASLAIAADTKSPSAYGYKAWAVDVLRPNGHARSLAAKRADGNLCNQRAMGVAPDNQTAYNNVLYKCMSDHGWKIVRTERVAPVAATASEQERLKILDDDAAINFGISHQQ